MMLAEQGGRRLGRSQGKGITDGTAPERAIKRDEVAAMLRRLGLLD